MDVENLTETLRQHGVSCVRAHGRYCSICDEAATALSTIQAENEKLRAELGKAKIERDMAAEDLLDAAIIPCLYCERNPGNGGACDMDSDNHEMFSCWKWRGIQKED